VPFVEELILVHGHHHAHKVPHDPVRPCAGFGLDNPANAREFIHGFKQLQKEWPHLTPGQRKLRLEDLSHQQLKKSGVPRAPVVGKSFKKFAYADTKFNQWQIEMPNNVINEAHLPEQSAQEFAAALYHESRHVEQGYLVIRRQAGIVAAQAHGKLTPAQQIEEMRRQLNRGGNDFAPAHVLAEAQKQPLHRGDAHEHCAQMMYDNFVGKYAAHNDKSEDQDNWKNRADLAAVRYEQVAKEDLAAHHKADQAVDTFHRVADPELDREADRENHLPLVLSPTEMKRREDQLRNFFSPEYYRVRAAAEQANAEVAAADAKLKRAEAYENQENHLREKSRPLYDNLPPEVDARDAESAVNILWGEN